MQVRRVVISGISRGLGRAMVTQFRQLAHWVAGCGRTALSDDRLAEMGLTAEQYTALDVSDINSVQRWAEHLLEISEPPDLLINNAGIINSRKPLVDLLASESRHWTLDKMMKRINAFWRRKGDALKGNLPLLHYACHQYRKRSLPI